MYILSGHTIGNGIQGKFLKDWIQCLRQWLIKCRCSVLESEGEWNPNSTICRLCDLCFSRFPSFSRSLHILFPPLFCMVVLCFDVSLLREAFHDHARRHGHMPYLFPLLHGAPTLVMSVSPCFLSVSPSVNLHNSCGPPLPYLFIYLELIDFIFLSSFRFTEKLSKKYRVPICHIPHHVPPQTPYY